MTEVFFRTHSQSLMARLMSDLTVGVEDAAAILGNAGHESGGLTNLEEDSGGGGYGWMQWTGVRRRQFENWCLNQNRSPKSLEGNYGFLVHELRETSEKAALPKLRAAQGLQAKVVAFELAYERAGVKHYESRLRWANIALEEYRNKGTGNMFTPPPDHLFTPPLIVPPGWLPPAKMDRVIFHWTAGGRVSNSLDREHYHILVEGDGKLVRGVLPITANQAPITGKYAAHTLNCNTGSIGVSMCAMAGAVERPFDAGPSPMTRVQWDRMTQVIADLCRTYKIAVSPTTVLSHAEVQTNLNITQRGKWDVAMLPFDQRFNTAKKCGDLMREQVSAVLEATTRASAVSAEAAARTPPSKGNVAGSAGAVVAAGTSTIVVNEMHKKGVSQGELVGMTLLLVVIVVAVFFTIRHVVRSQ